MIEHQKQNVWEYKNNSYILDGTREFTVIDKHQKLKINDQNIIQCEEKFSFGFLDGSSVELFININKNIEITIDENIKIVDINLLLPYYINTSK